MCRIPHRVMVSHIKETPVSKEDPAGLVVRNAYNKANAVASRLKTGLVIGADSVAYAGNHIIGKLGSRAKLTKTLKLMGGRVSFAYTGLALIDIKNRVCVMSYARTTLKFKKPSGPELARWTKIIGFRPECAGGFSVDGPGAMLMPHIEGCYFNILGMPLSKMAELFDGLGYNILDFVRQR